MSYDKRYCLGLDFGTLSVRALLVDIESGEEVATAACDYPHGVMDTALPCGVRLGMDWALQDPQDYLDVLGHITKQVIKESGVSPDAIIGVGADFTASSPMPVKADGTPLCFLDEFKCAPHAYVKLWKHHGAQEQADRMNEVAKLRSESWLARYGGKISSEWMLPKIWQLLCEAPEIYASADYIIEAGDWLIWQLCGVQTRNSCAAGYKAFWSKKDGYPSKDFFKALDARLENVVSDKLNCPVSPLGSRAGFITAKAAALTGLREGTPVAVAIVDAHACVPAAAIDGEGKMLAIIGTSTGHLLVGRHENAVDGICGVVEDGILPGFFSYEAGQTCVGDHFAWFIDNCLPADYIDGAMARGMNIHEYLREKARSMRPGESGLIALDWWNGNRSVLCDADLSGVILGMTLSTKPEEIYRALIEATAYGTRCIIENFRRHGIAVDYFCAAGGISQKDPMMMQIYADVIGMPVHISGSRQAGALGSAIFGAVAAGAKYGGYDDIAKAAAKMGKVKSDVYNPIPENTEIYSELYAEYMQLHDYFGRGGNDIMKRLKNIKSGIIK